MMCGGEAFVKTIQDAGVVAQVLLSFHNDTASGTFFIWFCYYFEDWLFSQDYWIDVLCKICTDKVVRVNLRSYLFRIFAFGENTEEFLGSLTYFVIFLPVIIYIT